MKTDDGNGMEHNRDPSDVFYAIAFGRERPVPELVDLVAEALDFIGLFADAARLREARCDADRASSILDEIAARERNG